LKEITTLELGIALGFMGVPNLEAITEGAAALGVADLQARVSGIRRVLVGDDRSKGLGPLLGGELTERLRAQLDTADEAIAAVDSPLRTAIATDTGSVRTMRAAIQAIETTVATEVMSKLGVKVSFSNFDGDSGF